MAVKALKKKDLSRIVRVVPQLLELGAKLTRFDYDEEADVLYISFERPQRATDSEMTDDGIVIRRRGNRIVGLTILDASKR